MSPISFGHNLVEYQADESLPGNVTSDQEPTNHEPFVPASSFVNLAPFFVLSQSLFAIGASRWCGGHAQSTRAVFMTTSDSFILFLASINHLVKIARPHGCAFAGNAMTYTCAVCSTVFLFSRCELVTTSTAGLRATDLYPIRRRWCLDLDAVRTCV